MYTGGTMRKLSPNGGKEYVQYTLELALNEVSCNDIYEEPRGVCQLATSAAARI